MPLADDLVNGDGEVYLRLFFISVGYAEFNAPMLKIVYEQHLLLPDVEAIRRGVQRLRQVQGPGPHDLGEGRAQ